MSRPHNPDSMRGKFLQRLLRTPATVEAVAADLGVSVRQVRDVAQRLRQYKLIEARDKAQKVAGAYGPRRTIYALTHEGRALALSLSGGPAFSRHSSVIRDLVKAETLRRAQDAGRARHANAGLAEAVRRVLSETDGLRMDELAVALGKDLKQTRKVVHDMLRSGAGIFSQGPFQSRTYHIFDSEAAKINVPFDPERPYRYAQPIRHGRGAAWFVESR